MILRVWLSSILAACAVMACLIATYGTLSLHAAYMISLAALVSAVLVMEVRR